jgi:hypothetical protein
MRTRPLRPSVLTFALLATLGAPTARAQPYKPKPTTARIFKSRAALAAALGQPIAKQLPASFDFQLFALVWVKLPVAAAPQVKIVTLPADRPLRYSHSGALKIELTRKGTTLRAAMVHDSPCSGGARRPPDMMAACYKRLQASMDAAKRTQVLFATPRARLRRVVATQRRLPPRP